MISMIMIMIIMIIMTMIIMMVTIIIVLMMIVVIKKQYSRQCNSAEFKIRANHWSMTQQNEV